MAKDKPTNGSWPGLVEKTMVSGEDLQELRELIESVRKTAAARQKVLTGILRKMTTFAYTEERRELGVRKSQVNLKIDILRAIEHNFDVFEFRRKAWWSRTNIPGHRLTHEEDDVYGDCSQQDIINRLHELSEDGLLSDDPYDANRS